MYNSTIISDSDSTITYQVQALGPTIPRPCCVSLLECAHVDIGLVHHIAVSVVNCTAK
jgi:hypothetical protein